MKHARKLLSMLVALATIFALLGLSGCSTNTTDYYETVLNLKQFTDMPDIEYRQVLNKYMDDLHGTYSGSDGNYTVTVKGNITSLQQEVVLKFSVSDDTEDSTKCVINSVTATINDNELDKTPLLIRYLIFFMPIPVAVVFLLSIIFNSTIGQFFGLALLVLFIGFMISFLGTALKRGSFCEGYINKSDTPVDVNDLVQFLNRNLSKTFPEYFHEWKVITIRNERGIENLICIP